MKFLRIIRIMLKIWYHTKMLAIRPILDIFLSSFCKQPLKLIPAQTGNATLKMFTNYEILAEWQVFLCDTKFLS